MRQFLIERYVALVKISLENAVKHFDLYDGQIKRAVT